MSQGNPSPHEIDTYCYEWVLNGGDQTKAWRKAFPESECRDKTTWEKASVMHNMEKVQARLVEIQAEQTEKDAEEFDLSVSELKTTLKKVMDAGLDGTVDSKGNSSPSNLGAVVSAVGEVNRMNGNHAATKQELTGKDGGAIETSDMSERDIARRIAFALAKGKQDSQEKD